MNIYLITLNLFYLVIFNFQYAKLLTIVSYSTVIHVKLISQILLLVIYVYCLYILCSMSVFVCYLIKINEQLKIAIRAANMHYQYIFLKMKNRAVKNIKCKIYNFSVKLKKTLNTVVFNHFTYFLNIFHILNY